MENVALAVTGKFSTYSGLRLNVRKSVAISMVQAEQNSDGQQVPLQPAARYLGHWAGDHDTSEEAWTRAFKGLVTRLVLATQKTNTPMQRAQIASALIVPKLCYVARHSWPSKAILQEATLRTRNFIWAGSFQHPMKAPTGWCAMDVLQLSSKNGGTGIPNIEIELQAMATQAIIRWADSAYSWERNAGNVLRKAEGITHTNICPAGVTPTHTWTWNGLWSEGEIHATEVLAEAPAMDDAAKIATLRATFKFSNGVSTKWTRKGLECDMRSVLGKPLLEVVRSQEASQGRFVPDGLPDVPIHSFPAFDSTGNRIRPIVVHKDILRGVHFISEVLSIEWKRRGVIVIRPCQFDIPMPSRAAHQFREFALSLIAAYPALLVRKPIGTSILNSHNGDDHHHELVLTARPCPTILHTWSQTSTPLGIMTTLQLDRSFADHINQPTTTTWTTPHPWISAFSVLWAGKRRWSRPTALIKKRLSQAQRRDAQHKLNKIQEDWKRDHETISAALAAIPWKRVYRIKGATNIQMQTLHRVKLRRLRLWNPNTKSISCAEHGCDVSAFITLTHLLWKCPATQALWNVLLSQWRAVGYDDSNAIYDIFSATIPAILTLLLESVQQAVGDTHQTVPPETVDVLYDAVQRAWALSVVITLQAIWQRRINTLYPLLPGDTPLRTAQVKLRLRLRGAFAQLQGGMPLTSKGLATYQAAALVTRVLLTATDATDSVQSHCKETFVAFFDGGSRGNPGPGGAGAIIYRIPDGVSNPVVEWIGCVALGSQRTTNNTAEFIGLLSALRYAASHNIRGLHIVGDSMLLITMLKERRPPKSKRLVRLYTQCRRLADVCRIPIWTHHYRHHNKVADKLANIAMDSHTSRQVQQPTLAVMEQRFTGAASLMANDIAKWKQEQQNMIATEQRKLQNFHHMCSSSTTPDFWQTT